MALHFILHDWVTNQEIVIDYNVYQHEGEEKSPGTNVWWRDDQGNVHSAFVKESPEEIREIMSKTTSRPIK